MTLPKPVPAAHYTEEYFRGACGGSEFFERFGPEVLKPSMAYSLREAGIGRGMRVLDLGCGRGEVLYHARKAGAFAAGTDFAASALRIAARASGCPVVRCDAKALPFAGGSFDRVFFLGVMDHLHDWELESCFRELERVLKPGGKVLAHTCCNRLYYKRRTYRARLAAARALRMLGLGVPDPSPQRSDEDERLHVNEHDELSLRAFFKRIGWRARVRAMPNYKLLARELYGETPPEGLPLAPSSLLKSALLQRLLWWPPLRWVLAREFFCEASPR